MASEVFSITTTNTCGRPAGGDGVAVGGGITSFTVGAAGLGADEGVLAAVDAGVNDDVGAGGDAAGLAHATTSATGTKANERRRIRSFVRILPR